MRSPQQVLTIALALTPMAAAWSQWLPNIDSLVVRQDDGTKTQDQPTKTPSPKSSLSDDSPEETGTAKPTQTGKDDDENKVTVTNTKDGKTTKTSEPKHKTFNPLDPAGGVNMIDPPTTAGLTLYRIDNTDPITWKWNYTSLQGKPSAVDVLISCSKATATWTLTQNMTFAPTATFTWDSNKFQNEQIGNQLPVEKYTLLIHDSEGGITDTPDPGYLAPFAGFQFGLYTAKPYENLNKWNCITCSGAAGGPLDGQVLAFAFSMTLVTMFSFTWYVTGIAGLV
ncbi:hypothetical protein F4808DRAFT_205396 [Astrocystis sublimbata]|nr:hypothetical protein F4808DRAFT_205396 [Astrocystis sublimbata]